MNPYLHNKILNFFLAVVHFLQVRREHLNLLDEQELSQLSDMSNQFILSYFEMVVILAKYIKQEQRKRRFSKPHFLIQLLNGYRYLNMDA